MTVAVSLPDVSTMAGMDFAQAAVLLALALYWLHWLTTEALLFPVAGQVLRGDAPIREFFEAGWACWLCKGHWFSAPLFVHGRSGVAVWLAGNTLHVMAVKALAIRPWWESFVDDDGPSTDDMIGEV